MKTKHLLFVLLFIPILYSSNAQNIVPNFSFEEQIDTTYCSWMGNATGDPCIVPRIEDHVLNWFQPSWGTADIYRETVPSSCYASTASTNGESKGIQVPLTGKSYVGLHSYTSGGFGCGFDYKEYVGVQLQIPVFPNIKYDCQINVSLADYSGYAINNIGMALTDSLINICDQNCRLDLLPSINSTDVIFNDTAWHTIRDTVTLAEEANYLYVGNFFPNDSTTIVSLPGNSTAYYYIEDVIVTPIYDAIVIDTICFGDAISFNTDGSSYYVYDMNSFDLLVASDSAATYTPTSESIYMQVFDSTAIKYEVYFSEDTLGLDLDLDLGIDTILCPQDTLVLDATNPDASYSWQDNSTESTFTVTDEGSYWVQVTSNCKTISDTIVVTHYAHYDSLCSEILSTVDEHEIDNTKFTFSPNPASSQLSMMLTGTKEQKYKIEIIDNLGRVIEVVLISPNKEAAFSIEHLPQGLYYLKLDLGNSLIIEKLIVR